MDLASDWRKGAAETAKVGVGEEKKREVMVGFGGGEGEVGELGENRHWRRRALCV